MLAACKRVVIKQKASWCPYMEGGRVAERVDADPVKVCLVSALCNIEMTGLFTSQYMWESHTENDIPL